MTEKLPVITRTWNIHGTVPSTANKYTNVANFHIGVEADSMELAMEAASRAFPGATFYSCTHRGEVHLRVAPDASTNLQYL